MENHIYMRSFPQTDSMLNVYLASGRYKEILPEWKGQDSADYHVVVSVTDEETAAFYRLVKEKSNEYVSMITERLPENEPWDIELKPLFRFDTIINSERFISMIKPYCDVDEQNEFILNLRLDYDDGWEPVRIITDLDFEKPNGFLSNIGEQSC